MSRDAKTDNASKKEEKNAASSKNAVRKETAKGNKYAAVKSANDIYLLIYSYWIYM